MGIRRRLPDITVLPALAELYGVTADDILAGQTLTGRTREKTDTQAMKKRLLARLRTRSDVCFILALAVPPGCFLKLLHLELFSLPLSVAVGWGGICSGVPHPIRYGGVEARVARPYTKNLSPSRCCNDFADTSSWANGRWTLKTGTAWSGDRRSLEVSAALLLGALATLWLSERSSVTRPSRYVRLLPGCNEAAPWLIWVCFLLQVGPEPPLPGGGGVGGTRDVLSRRCIWSKLAELPSGKRELLRCSIRRR